MVLRTSLRSLERKVRALGAAVTMVTLLGDCSDRNGVQMSQRRQAIQRRCLKVRLEPKPSQQP